MTGERVMTTPLVSVVTAVHNGESCLSDAIEGILNQTLANLELIVVNDGSTDATAAVIAAYARRDARIRVITQDRGGLTQALIDGCHQARGAFIARQDADDWSYEDRLEKQLTLFERDGGVAMASCWTDYVDDLGNFLQRLERPSDPAEATQGLLLRREGPPAHGTMMFRRKDYDAVGGYRLAFYYSQDSDLWLRLAGLGTIAYIPEVLYRCRMSPSSISSVRSVVQRRFGELGRQASAVRLANGSDADVLREAEELRQEILCGAQDDAAAVRSQRAAAAYRIGTMLSRQGNSQANRHFRSAIRADPWHWRSWGRLAVERIRRVVTWRRSDSAEPPAS